MRPRGMKLTLAAAALTASALGTAACGTAVATSAIAYQASAAKPPGWRVVQTIGPAKGNVSGLLTADSATDAWSVWTGPGVTLAERWTGRAWTRIRVPGALAADADTAVAIGASSASDLWLFGAFQTTKALRWTGAHWVTQTIPSWVLRRDSSGTVTATTAVFSRRDVWVFSLGTGGREPRLAVPVHDGGHGDGAGRERDAPEQPGVRRSDCRHVRVGDLRPDRERQQGEGDPCPLLPVPVHDGADA